MHIRTLSIIALPAVLLFGCPAQKKEKPATDKTKQPMEKPAEKPMEKPAEKPMEEKPEETGAMGEGTGTVKGVVTFKGEAPKPEKIDMKKDPKCTEINKGQSRQAVKVEGGKLAEVFVHVTGLPDKKWDTREDAVSLDQKGCVYHPRMIGIQVGQKLSILNSDPLLHNVHAHAKRSEFNQAMPKQGMKIEKDFKKADMEAKISCEVHPWMNAALRIVEDPFFQVTGKDGAFTIENVPAGKYKLEFEHKKLGKKTMDVEVTKDGTAEVNAEFGG